MAVPTLTTITPDTGHPGGLFLVTIVGTNFDVPPLPPATGIPPATEETVQIEIDGRLATEVQVFSSTLITCLIPAYRRSPSLLNATPGLDVDVKISNVGPPLEEDTFTDAFTYSRPDLTRDEALFRHIFGTLILEMRRQIIDNINMSTHIDYDSTPGDGFDIVELASVPGIGLFGPAMREDLFRRRPERKSQQNLSTLEFITYRKKRYEIASFEASFHAQNPIELLAITQEFTQFFTRNPELKVLSDPSDPASDDVGLEIFLTSDPRRTGSSNESSTLDMTATFEIHGIEVDADDRVPVRWGKVLDDPPDITVQSEGQ